MRKGYLFLGFAIPDDEMTQVFAKDQFPSIQTHKFNWNLIKAIEEQGAIDCTYVSVRPVSPFPVYPRKLIKKKKWTQRVSNKEIEIVEIPFWNTTFLKIFTIFLSTLFYSLENIIKKKIDGGIIVYSVHLPYLIVGYLLSRVFKLELIAVWTDPPALKNIRDSRLKASLRNIEMGLSKFLMSKFDKVVSITKFLASEYAPNAKSIILEGIIGDSEEGFYRDVTKKHLNADLTRDIVYTGSIEKKYGIENLVKGFLLLKAENVRLVIYGRGNYQDELIELCKEHSNLIYGGFVDSVSCIKIQQEASFLITTRSPMEDFVKYSFPSKILEYMMSNTPVITTILPGMPQEYENYVIGLKDNKPATIKEGIHRALNYNQDQICSLSAVAREYALKKHYRFQGISVIEFILQEGKKNHS